MTASFYFIRLSILYGFILFGRKVALAAECVGNEEIKHLAMMTPASSRRELVFFLFYQNCNIKCGFKPVINYIQKGDKTWSIISVMKPQSTGGSVQNANRDSIG